MVIFLASIAVFTMFIAVVQWVLLVSQLTTTTFDLWQLGKIAIFYVVMFDIVNMLVNFFYDWWKR